MGKDPLLDFVESIIRSWDLLDFKPKRDRFTWSNKKAGSESILAHLDRFLVQSSLLDENLLISSKKFPKISSDHHHITLQMNEEEDYGPILFRFSPLWIERDGYWGTVCDVWSQYVDGSPNYVREEKLKKLSMP